MPKVKIGLFMGVGFLCWFYGMHLLFNFASVQSGLGVGNEFIYIIAAVVGGCLLTGGYGSAIGAAIGAFIFGMTDPGHRLRRVRPQLVLHLPRRDAAARGAGQPLHQNYASTRARDGDVMTDTIDEHADPTLHKGEPLVEMEDVGKAFGPIVALEGINLTVRAGEVACVLGDNGAGKSTLIKIISGLHPHTSGTLKVDGAGRSSSARRATRSTTASPPSTKTSPWSG